METDRSFHISDVKKMMRCPKFFWNALREEAQPFQPFARLDEAVTELACKKLGIEDYFLGQKNDTSEMTQQKLDAGQWVVKGRFEYQNLRIKLPIVHKTEEGLDVFFVFIGNYPKDDDVLYYSSNLWVMKKLGYEIHDIKIIHLNGNYVREDELDVDQLFIVSDSFYNDKGRVTKPIFNHVMSRMIDLGETLDYMQEVAISEDVPSIRTKKCVRRTKCPYYDSCFPNEKQEEDDSILTLVSSQHKYDMAKEGLRRLKDADLERVEGTRQQYAQIMASKNGGLYVDRLPLKMWLNDNIKFPVAFLDFEWDTYAVPPYKGLKPFSVVCFEYSIHILKEDGSLTHHDFIGTQDCREEFIENLIHDIGSAGSVVAFNADGAEKIRLKELADQFPHYRKELDRICDAMVDLAMPFQLGMVYDVRMRGLYSLKVLLSVFSDSLSYQDLSIHHGMDAVYSWRMMDKKQADNEEELKQRLSEYCGMDTYSMVVLYKWLISHAQEDKNETC